MVKILNCYLYAKKSYGTLSKGAIFLGQPCIFKHKKKINNLKISSHCLYSTCYYFLLGQCVVHITHVVTLPPPFFFLIYFFKKI